ncbi:MAG: leucine-rich repeat protein [Clostridia bacterium]|nr:leucine-rich repeat protein [Clostridia bacterium]
MFDFTQGYDDVRYDMGVAFGLPGVRQNYTLLGYSRTPGGEPSWVFAIPVDEHIDSLTIYPIWQGNQRRLLTGTEETAWLDLDIYESMSTKIYRQGDTITLPSDLTHIQAMDQYKNAIVKGFVYKQYNATSGEYENVVYAPGASITVGGVDEYIEITLDVEVKKVDVTFDLCGGTWDSVNFADQQYEIGTNMTDIFNYDAVRAPSNMLWHAGWNVTINGETKFIHRYEYDPNNPYMLEASDGEIVFEAVYEEKTIQYFFNPYPELFGYVVITGSDITLNYTEEEFKERYNAYSGGQELSGKLSHFEFNRNGQIETALPGGKFSNVTELVSYNNMDCYELVVNVVWVNEDQLLTFHTATTPDELECEMTLPAGKNLLDISGRTLGTLSSGFENNNTRQFELDKYYVGLSSGNYYSPTSVTYSIDNNTVTVKTNLSAYGLAFPVKVKPNVKYVCNTAIRVNFYTASGEYISWGQTAAGQTFTAPSNCEIVTIILLDETPGETKTFTDIQLQEGADVSNYEVYSSKTAIEKVEKSKVTATTLLFKGAKFTIPSAIETEKTENGVTKYFVGWSTDEDSSTVEYYAGDSWTYNSTQSLDFYPVYETADEILFTFTDNGDGTCAVSGLTDEGKTKARIIIPSTYNGMTVTTIGSEAFYNNTTVQRVVIPSSIKSIGGSAFGECYGLRNVTFAENSQLETIGDSAFFECPISSIELPSSLKTIGSEVFWATDISFITIPENVTTIDKYAFNLSSIQLIHNLSSVEIAGDEGGFYGYIANGGKIVKQNGIFYHETDDEVIAVCNIVYGVFTSLREDTTIICDGAFAEIHHDADIIIPASVKYIGDAAFIGSNSLDWGTSIIHSVTFAEGSQLEYIGENAFYDCHGITSIVIPAGVKEIGNNAFEKCINLKVVVNLSDLDIVAGADTHGMVAKYANRVINADFIENNIAYKISGDEVIAVGMVDYTAESITLREDTTQIADNAFRLNMLYIAEGQNEYLKSVHIPASVTHIGSSAFYYCKNLTTVTFAEGSQLKTLGGFAFSNCNISSIDLPEGLTNIPSWIFECCPISSIHIPASVKVIEVTAFAENNIELETVTFAEGSQLERIGGGAFSNCVNLKNVVLPASVNYIGNGAFSYGGMNENGMSVTLTNKEGWQYSDDYEETWHWVLDGTHSDVEDFMCENPMYFYRRVDEENTRGVKYTLSEDGTYYIVSGAESGVTDVMIRDSLDGLPVKEIKTNAFAYNSTIKNLIIPANVTIINETAFYACTALKSVEFEDGSLLTTIDRGAFQNCTALAEFTISEKVTTFGNNAFLGCTSLKKIINNSDIYIAPGSQSNGRIAFYADIVVGINIYNGVQYKVEGEDIIAIGITDLNLGDYELKPGTTKIRDKAFMASSIIKSIVIPASVKSIGEKAFYQTTSLETVVFEEGSQLTEIGAYLFYECANLKSITIPASVKTIEERAFYDCTNLKEVIFEQENSQLTSIGATAFYHTGLTYVVIPENVTSIGKHAFYISTLHTLVNKSDINIVLKAVDEDYSIVCQFADMIFTSEVEWTEETNTDTGVSYRIYTPKDGQYLTFDTLDGSDYSQETFKVVIGVDDNTKSTYVLDDDTNGIGYKIFESNKNLTHIVIPENVKSIGCNAFGNCFSLAVVVNLSEDVKLTNIAGTTEDYGCLNYYIAELYTEEVTVESYTNTTTNIKYLIVKKDGVQVDKIAVGIADESINTTTVTLDADTTIVGYAAFRSNTTITSLVLNDGLKRIAYNAFRDCSALSSINAIPDTVIDIGAKAFRGTAITYIELKSAFGWKYSTDGSSWIDIDPSQSSIFMYSNLGYYYQRDIEES